MEENIAMTMAFSAFGPQSVDKPLIRAKATCGIAFFWILHGILLGGGAAIAVGAAERHAESDDSWTLVFDEGFSDRTHEQRWLLEGLAELQSVERENGSCLRMATQPSPTNARVHHSVLWCKQRFDGDLRFVFQARGQKDNRISGVPAPT